MPFWLVAIFLTSGVVGAFSPIWMPLMPDWFFGL